MIRARLADARARLQTWALETRDHVARRVIALRRPRVGPWVEGHHDAASRFDDRGQYVAGVGPVFDPRGIDRYSWTAHVPFKPMVTDDAPSKAEAMRRADAVLATWATLGGGQ